MPVITWSGRDDPGAAVQLPGVRSVDLGSLSPLLPRIARQHGYYVTHVLGWDRIIDYGEALLMHKKAVFEYGVSGTMEDGLAAKRLTQEFLFPPPEEDSFKAYLWDQGIETFL